MGDQTEEARDEEEEEEEESGMEDLNAEKRDSERRTKLMNISTKNARK